MQKSRKIWFIIRSDSNKNDPELIQTLEFADNYFKTVMTVLHMFDNLSRIVKDNFLEKNNIVN